MYNGREDWEDIIEDDGDHLSYPHERTSTKDHQFTFALEPGFDVFIRKRSIAVGARAWLPIVGTSDSSLDNVGIMVNVTFTPMWRERPALRPEYEHPASTMEEEMGEEPVAQPETPAEPEGEDRRGSRCRDRRNHGRGIPPGGGRGLRGRRGDRHRRLNRTRSRPRRSAIPQDVEDRI